MNMMGFRPVGYQEGGEAAAEARRREGLIRTIIELSGITNQETLMGLQGQDTSSLQNTLNGLIARKQAEQMSRMQGSSVGELTSDQRRQLMELPSQTDFMGRPTTPEQQMPYGTSEAPGLGQGVTENPGFSKETLEYFPPQRSSGGIMSLRR